MKKNSAEMDDEDLSAPTPEQSAYLRRQQNPYAKLSVLAPGGETKLAKTNEVREPLESTRGMSKKDFVSGCGRIFGFYVPSIEKVRLRPHQRAFIERNHDKSAEMRRKIYERLRKYDLSDLAGLEGRFNREDDDLTEEKLKEIEKDTEK
jgi:hypothetical protein